MNNIQCDDIEPLVSICVFTYNHEKYISQTLEGLIMQRASFLYEIIVHDDASTDNTKSIIEKYRSDFPDIIKPIFQKENKYSISKFNFQYEYVYPTVNGKYIAICDGDDYWIDPTKLQKQVDFLELHSEYGLIHTKAAKYYEDKQIFKGVAGCEFKDFESLLRENTVVHSTVCFRSCLFEKYRLIVEPQAQTKWTTDDYPIWLWFAQYSKIKFLTDITTIYRQVDGSLSHISDDIQRLNFTEGIYEIANFYMLKFPCEINDKQIRSRYYSGLIGIYLLTRKWNGVKDSIKAFYIAKDWLNILWIAITLPFSFSRFMIKASYRVRTIVFELLNIYPIRN